MNCGNCGMENDEAVSVCAGCGVELIREQSVPKRSGKKLFIAIGAAVAVIAVALLLIFGLRTPRLAAKMYVSSWLKPNGNGMLKVIPEAVVKETIGDKENYVGAIEQEIQNLYDDLDHHFDSWSVDYKIADVVNDVDKYVLEAIRNYYKDEYDLKVEKVKGITVDLTVNLDGQKETAELIIYAIKVGGRWYVDTRYSSNPVVRLKILLYS